MVSRICAVVWSTWAMTRTLPVVLGSEKIARAIPPRVVVWEGSSTALLAHTGSSSNVTGTPSTACPWASCTRTITSATWGNCAARPGSTCPTQIISGKTCREKTYPEPAVGPTSFGAQAWPPKARTRPIKTRTIRRPIRFSFGSNASRPSPGGSRSKTDMLDQLDRCSRNRPEHYAPSPGLRPQWRPGAAHP
jgi:hypothetical protein